MAIALGGAVVIAGAVFWLLRLTDSDHAETAPAPVSHIGTATRACLLTSTDSDTTGTWAAMREMAGTHGSTVVVQRYRLPAGADPVAYVNTLVQLRCDTVVTTGTTARSAVAARLAAGRVPHVRFVIVADQPVPGATHLSPDTVSAPTLAQLVSRSGSTPQA
jgi:ABC-type branched-subunit amino acid transport system substrate-binding protein